MVSLRIITIVVGASALLPSIACAAANPAPVNAASRPAPPKVGSGGKTVAASSYVVQPGDTLYRISKRFETSVEHLSKFNELRDPTALRAGQTLRIPPKSSPRSGKVALAPAPTPAPKPSPAQQRLRELGAAPSPPVREATPPAPKPALAPAPQAKPKEISPAPVRAKKYPLRWPLEGDLGSRYGKRGGKQHDGIDLAAEPGTPIRAAADGDVIFADEHGGYGNLVLVRHASGLITVYAHNEKNLVRKGQRVKGGQVIATVGSTGNARGAHLHFEVRRGVRAENPLAFLPP